MRSRRILIVDDDPDVREGMRIRLEASGFEACVAHDGLSAIAEARKQHPDLIVLDLGLPAGDGFLVIEHLRNIPSLAGIPVIVVSGRDVRSNRARAVKAGAKLFLQKPVDNAELLAVVRRALGDISEEVDLPHSTPPACVPR